MVGVVLVCSLLSGCDVQGGNKPNVVVGAGSSLEQQVLAAIAVRALERAGFDVELRRGLGETRGLRRRALAGDIDVYWDYTGAAWSLGMNQESPPADLDESFERVARADRERGLSWLDPSAANATLALFVRQADVPGGSRPPRLSWLARQLSAVAAPLCADAAFLERPGGLDALAAAYGMNLERVRDQAVAASESEALRLAAVDDERCFAALGTATSGPARNLRLVRVTDDRVVFPAFLVAPVARTARLETGQDIAAVLRRVTDVLDTDALAAMNAAAGHGRALDRIADDFLSR